MRFSLQRNNSVPVGAILISLVLLCGWGNPTLAAAPNPARTGSGTGFFITEDGYLLTNHHVINRAARITVKSGDKEYAAKIVKVDKLKDLAVLKVEGRFAALPVASSRKVGLGQEVFTVGFPQVDVQGFSPKFTKGEISSLAGIKDNPRDFQISVPVQPGNSGGPLVDEFGNVVGVVVARLNEIRLLIEKGTLPQNVNYAVKSSFANSFIESLPKVVEKLKDPNPRNQPRILTDVIKEVQAATVLILVKSHKIHVLARGDSFWSISKKYGVKYKDIVAANPTVIPTRLRIGQKIYIPPADPIQIPEKVIGNKAGVGFYIVKSGDTLGHIALKHGITVKELTRTNPNIILRMRIGQKLIIPASKLAPPPNTPASSATNSETEPKLSRENKSDLNQRILELSEKIRRIREQYSPDTKK